MPELFIGLMSGTSLDGVDGVLADFSGPRPRVLAHAALPFDPVLRAELLALNSSGPDELHRAALAGNALMRSYASVVHRLLVDSGTAASQVEAIGAHGQTVRHRPREFDGTGYTLQLAQPALLAELSGITVVADFRSRDVAAGGQGAPLAPFFHRAIFGGGAQALGVLNIGGIANLTVLRPDGTQLGFDCGPGNALLDFWCERHTGRAYDNGGAWGASGRVLPPLLEALRTEPFLHRAPPKSTGRDLFNPAWLLPQLPPGAAPADVQATLAEFSAGSAADAVLQHGGGLQRLVVCGGGAYNRLLMDRLQALLPGVLVVSSDTHGLPPLQVEAAAFAWLAHKALRREPLELQSTTGAQGARVLGAVWPA